MKINKGEHQRQHHNKRIVAGTNGECAIGMNKVETDIPNWFNGRRLGVVGEIIAIFFFFHTGSW